MRRDNFGTRILCSGPKDYYCTFCKVIKTSYMVELCSGIDRTIYDGSSFWDINTYYIIMYIEITQKYFNGIARTARWLEWQSRRLTVNSSTVTTKSARLLTLADLWPSSNQSRDLRPVNQSPSSSLVKLADRS